MVGFNEEEKRALLARHNYLRSREGASDMMAMKWDEKLEKSAQVYSEKCIFEHSKNRENLAGYRYVGENLYAGTGEFDPPNVIQLFYDEKYNYSYDTGQCFISMCGHYTQVVWSSSNFLGCGVKYCPVLQGASTFDHGYIVVCHYGPGGNIQGRKPFTKGDKCTKCPAETKYCHKGMCVVRPQIGVSTHIHSTTYTLTLGVALLAVLCIL
ncbi:GLIPR1-like protein 1 isoform X2 [Physella acuta]|nr:GLIPR1-like protein 1 isoform X2 [Physella acuta]